MKLSPILLITINEGLRIGGILNDVYVGEPYYGILKGYGGIEPYSWFISSGSLPSGITAATDSNGDFVFSGTSSAEGKFPITVTLRDSNGRSVSRDFIMLMQAEPLSITGYAPDGVIGVPYSYSYSVTGGVAPYFPFLIIGGGFGPLPSGLTMGLDSNGDVVIYGTPDAGGTYTYKIGVNDSQSPASFTYLTDTFSIGYATLASSGALTNSPVGGPVQGSITLSGGDGTYTLDASPVSGARPPGNGLSLIGAVYSDSSGSITTEGSYSWTDRFRSGDGQTLDIPFTVSALFNPIEMFSAGQRGGWWDPSDLSTLFQDSAGTIPVTAAGQSVGKMLDKSGNGNHFTQATSGKRAQLLHDGTNYYLQLTATNSQFMSAGNGAGLQLGYDSITMILGWKSDLSVDMGLMCRAKAAGVPGRYAFTKNPPNIGMLYTNDYTPGTGVGVSGANASTANQVLSCQLDRTVALVPKMWIDGASAGTPSGSSPADSGTNRSESYRFLLGAYNDASDSGEIAYATGRFYGGIVWLTGVDSAVRQKAEIWIGGKCGVTI